MEVFLSQVKINSDSEFAKKFNAVSDLFAQYQNPDLTEEERDLAFTAWWEAKYRLESGQ